MSDVCVCVCVCVCVHTYIHTYIYISKFIYNILIKTIKTDTFKEFVETTVLVHAFIGNGNTLLNSQPSLRGSEVCSSAMLVMCLVISKWQLSIS